MAAFQPVEAHPSLASRVLECVAGVWRQCCSSSRITMRGGIRVTQHEKLAEGAFSLVYRAVDDSGVQYALKQILVQTPEQAQLATWEIEVASSIRHPNVLALVDWTKAPHPRGEMYNLITPLARRGTLRQRLDSSPPSEDEAIEIFRGVCLGVQALHRHEPDAWAHRDIKPENVLIGDDGTPLITDLGSVARARVEVSSRAIALTLQDQAAEHSSMSYRAPELFDAPFESVVDERSDVWSLGCLLYAMAFRYSPFECKYDQGSGEMRIVDCTYLRVIAKISFPPSTPFSQEYCDLIQWILQVEHTQRPHVADILERLEGYPRREGRSEFGAESKV